MSAGISKTIRPGAGRAIIREQHTRQKAKPQDNLIILCSNHLGGVASVSNVSIDDLLVTIGEGLQSHEDGEVDTPRHPVRPIEIKGRLSRRFQLRRDPQQEDDPRRQAAGPEVFRKERMVLAARNYLSKRYDELHHTLCKDAERRTAILAMDEATAIAAVCDVVAPLAIGFPPFVLGTLVVKIGIKRLCTENPFRSERSDDDPK